MRTRVIIYVSVLLLQVMQVKAQGFDSIRATPKKDRSGKALDIFNRSYLHAGPVSAFRALAQLNDIAVQLGDKALGLTVYELKANYYTENYGYNNPHSIACFDTAIDLSRKYGMAVDEGRFIFQKGLFYDASKKYVSACANFLNAYDLFKKEGFDHIPDISIYLRAIGSFYYKLGDFETSKRYLLEALINKPPQRNEITLTNTIGMIYRSNYEYDKAMLYFNKALGLAKKYNDQQWQGIATGNIGSVYFMKKNYDVALPYLKTDFEASRKYGDNINAAIAMLRIAAISIERKNFSDAGKQLSIVETLITRQPEYTLKERIADYAQRAELYQQTGKLSQALVYRKNYEAANDSLIKQQDALAVQRLKLNYELNKQQFEVAQLTTKAKAEGITRNTLIGVLLLLMVISVLLYNRQKLIIKRDQAALLLEKSRADQERDKTRLALIDYTDKLRQQTDLVESFKAELTNMQRRADPLYQLRVSQLEDMMKAHIMTDKAWKEFKKLFDKVHPVFFAVVNSRFQNLTETDLRLLALVKLRLNNLEMAVMLGITVEGVKKSKQRLRKKSGVPEENNLDEVVAAI
jgi:tetratricopeptide (TPR) repeat protein